MPGFGIRDSGFEHRHASAPSLESPTPNPESLHAIVPMHTACVWSEKTTVCRIFSCQRSFGAPPRTPARSLAGPFAPLRSLAARSLAFARRVATLALRSQTFQRPARVNRAGSQSSGGFRAPARPARLNAAPSLLVENTGLEPVTSWLQTRRSPS